MLIPIKVIIKLFALFLSLVEGGLLFFFKIGNMAKIMYN